MDDTREVADFEARLAVFRGCQFTALREREDIEQLVQEYIDRPDLHARARTVTLLSHLLSSEVAPTARVAKTGLDPTGFPVATYPGIGRWLIYGLFLALWAVAAFEFQRGQYAAAAAMGLVTAMVARRWWVCFRVVRDVNWALLRELRWRGCFDPVTHERRLWRLERRGFRPHSNVYALLRICRQEQRRAARRRSRSPEYPR